MPWSFNESKYDLLLQRITNLERAFNDLAVAQDNLATLAQLQELLVVIQSSIKDLNDRVIALENRVKQIEDEPLN
jgi:BMFP domain-containing protein YqiC